MRESIAKKSPQFHLHNAGPILEDNKFVDSTFIKRNLIEYPNHTLDRKLGKHKPIKRSYIEEIDLMIQEAKDERPNVLRSNIVEKYVREILNKDKNPSVHQKKLNVVRKMMELKVDNRILNSMRQVMNEQIEDERGLMSIMDFKKMFYTSFGRGSQEKTTAIYNMLLPIILGDNKTDSGGDAVSIGNLSSFIDFFNYYPFVMSVIRHKNDSSEDLYLFMGK